MIFPLFVVGVPVISAMLAVAVAEFMETPADPRRPLSTHSGHSPVAIRRSPATAGGHHARIRFYTCKTLLASGTGNWTSG
jgi:hypothetical protein